MPTTTPREIIDAYEFIRDNFAWFSKIEKWAIIRGEIQKAI